MGVWRCGVGECKSGGVEESKSEGWSRVRVGEECKREWSYGR